MTERRPYWPAVTVEALSSEANIGRVFADMAFDRYLGSLPRGSFAWWRPDYVAIRPDTFTRYGERNAVYLANRRADAATFNRARRDSPVHMLALGDRVICIDEWCGDGAWRSADGHNRGESLIDLGMWRWSTSYGKAASRIARALGFQIPELPAPPRMRSAA